MAEVEDKILDHNYDGILEYDNPLPAWWVYLFLITIAYAVIYMFYYHVAGIGLSQHEEFIAETENNDEAIRIALERQKMWAEIEYVAVESEEGLAAGREIFVNNCVSCHANNGGGGIGPNLTDNYYLHGSDIEATMKVIINGVPEKGMQSWKAQFSPEEVKQVASYVLSLSGQNVEGGKPPQGELIEM